jgi:hypothetical protein
MKPAIDQEITWRPQPGPQTAFVHCTFADEIFFGGARGGGKTDAALGKLLIKAITYGKGMKGIFFRRTYKQLEEVMIRARELYQPHGAIWKESNATFTFPGGATIKMRYLDRDQDAENYQGHNYTDIVIEEAGNFPDIKPILKLKATLRSARGVPTQMLLTGNPGGVGAGWIRQRYIDPCPTGWETIKEVETRTLTDGRVMELTSTRIYIPSRVTDNVILLENDPGYIARLAQSGSEQIVKAWLEGDFYAVDGAFFDCWDQKKHVLSPTELPVWWTRFRMMDWGSAKPFCNLWGALASEDWQHPIVGVIIPKNALIIYREWYGIKMRQDGTIETNTGLKMFAEPVAQGILAREKGDRIDYGVLDPSAFAVDGGVSIAERMFRATGGRVAFRRADNRRAGVLGALSGWDQVRARLIGEAGIDGRFERPMLYVFSTCHHLIRTLPMMQHDPDRPEDIDTTAEDHAVDALRYGCMSRPYDRPEAEKPKKMTSLSDVTLDQLWYDDESSRGANSVDLI